MADGAAKTKVAKAAKGATSTGAAVVEGDSKTSAALKIAPTLVVELRDARTGAPLPRAALEASDISVEGKDEEGYSWKLDFDIPEEPPEYALPFSAKQEKALKKAIADRDAALQKIELLTEEHERAADSDGEADAAVQERLEALRTEWLAANKKRKPPRKWRDKRARRDAEYKKLSAAAKKTEKELKKVARKIAGEEKKRDAALKAIERGRAAREARCEWAAGLTSMLRLLGHWDGETDGIERADFQKKFKDGYRKAVGRKVPRNWKGLGWDLIRQLEGDRLTDAKGRVPITLPPNSKGKVRVEFAYHKILKPEDSAKAQPNTPKGPAGFTRPNYDDSKASGDDPRTQPRPQESGWSLVAKIGGKDEEFRFQNWIEVDFDTTKPQKKPLHVMVLGMTWCQPAWTPVGEKEVLLEGDDRARLQDGRGLADGVPTMLISSTGSGSGKEYGRYGRARNVGKVKYRFGSRIKKYGEGWYTWTDDLSMVAAFRTELEAMAWFIENCADAREMEAYEVYRVPGVAPDWMGPDDLGLFMVDGPEDPASYVVYRVRKDYQRHATRSDAQLEVMDNHWGSKKSILAEPLGEDGKRRWRVRWRNAAGKEGLEKSEVVDDLAAVEKLLSHRMHMGVDVAGNVGQAVFAPVGGSIRRVWTTRGSGRVVKVRGWTRKHVTDFNLLHNKEVTCEVKMRVKAGDQVAVMGRTGNPAHSSPTHVHIQALHKGDHVDYRSVYVPGHGPLVPTNETPLLLPCSGEFGDASGKNPAEGPANRCAFRTGNPDADSWKYFRVCWAGPNGEKSCPFGFEDGKALFDSKGKRKPA